MKRHAALAVKLGMGAALLGLLLALVDLAALRAVLAQVNRWVILSLPVFYLHTAVKALRWRLYLQSRGVALSCWEANRIYLSGTFLGLVSPGRVGEVYRAWILHRERGVHPGLGLAAVVVDRLADIAVLLSLGAAGLVYLAGQGLAGAAAMTLGPVAGRARIAALLRRQFTRLMGLMPAPVATELPDAWRVFAANLRAVRTPLLLRIVALTLLSISIYCAHLFFIARVLGLPVGFLALSGVLCAATFVTLLPISVNGIGTRDAFLVATLPLLGVERAAALGFALVFLLLFVANTLMALPFWLARKRTAPPDGIEP